MNCRHRHRKQSGGSGQFADVAIEVTPLARGAGELFEEAIKGGAVPRNVIAAVEAGVRDARAEGRQGLPALDVRVTLTDGKHHAVGLAMKSDHLNVGRAFTAAEAHALLPMTARDELNATLASATRGTAWFAAAFDHYPELRPVSLAKA